MKEELYHLLDGELSDSETADLLRHLSEDGADRSLFRQQMKLNGALARNEHYDSMSSSEEGEMVSRLIGAIGANEDNRDRGGWFSMRAVALVLMVLLLGGGLGYIAGDLFRDQQHVVVPTVEKQVVSPSHGDAPLVVTPPFNRDSVVAAILDSLQQKEMAKPATSYAAKKKVINVKKVNRRRAKKDPIVTGIRP